MNQNLILVNDVDEEIGIMEKIDAHLIGLKHRAFSIFIFNSKNQLLIQQRASSKYHSENLWANTCCGHPLQNENTIEAAQKRLQEEFGFTSELKPIFSFSYKEKIKHLIENEFDHVFIGFSDQKPQPNPEEIQDYKYIDLNELKNDVEKNPINYASWFKIIMTTYLSKIEDALK
ncbi:MAG: isopentenyl-diphosphate Delta-isomerase [Chitinophagaceae bacterium]|nr:isopentenyl-diphosphate Delta-isomerase [Chitinophagaceae bacterium]